MKSYDESLVKEAKSDPNYGKKPFSYKKPATQIEFGGVRAPEKMEKQLLDPFNPKYKATWEVALNELTWLIRHATVSSTISVNKKGIITISHSLSDKLDLRPSDGRTRAYNYICTVMGAIYHDVLGGNDKMKVKAKWKIFVE